MGFNPLSIPYLCLCHKRELGVADPTRIRVAGTDIAGMSFGFSPHRSFVIWGDQLIRKELLRPLEKLLFHSPLVVRAPLVANLLREDVWSANTQTSCLSTDYPGW